MVGVLGFDNLTQTDGAFDIEDNIITLDVRAESGSTAEGYPFQGRRWSIHSIDEDSQGGNRYLLHLETEDGLDHGLSQSLGTIDNSMGLKAISTWVDTGDTKSTGEQSSGGSDSEIT